MGKRFFRVRKPVKQCDQYDQCDRKAQRSVCHSKGAGQQGSVLILLLWVLVIISYLASDYAAHTRRDGAVAFNDVVRFRQDNAIQSVLTLLASGKYDALIKGVNETDDTEWGPDELAAAGIEVTPTDRDGRYASDHAVKIKKALQSWLRLVVDGVVCYVNVTLASERIHLSLKNEAQIRSALKEIYGEDRLEASEAFADSIMDWLDADDLVRLNGAETSYYTDQYPAYHPGNGPFQSMSQLFLIKGFEARSFWGNFTSVEAAEGEASFKKRDPFVHFLNWQLGMLSPEPQKNENKASDGEIQDSTDRLGGQSLLDRFTVYPGNYKRVTFCFPNRDRLHQEIVFLANMRGEWMVVEQLGGTIGF